MKRIIFTLALLTMLLPVASVPSLKAVSEATQMEWSRKEEKKVKIYLSSFENAVVYFFSSLPFISAYCPCIFHLKPFVHTRHFSLFSPVFRETGFAVNWFAFCGFKRHCSRFATLSTFNFKHPFLGHVTHLYTLE